MFYCLPLCNPEKDVELGGLWKQLSMNPHTVSDLLAARDLFRDLLSRYTTEREWQRFFTDHPYVLSLSLPVRLEPADLVPLGRPGRAEPDFVFYPCHIRPIPYYGIIELKRPDSSIVSAPRSNTVILTRDAETAIQQANTYARDATSFVPIDVRERPLFLGNNAYLFVIMGMSEELATKLGHDLYRETIERRLPENLQLLPYDSLLHRFESHIPLKLYFLVTSTSENTKIEPHPNEKNLLFAVERARNSYVTVTLADASRTVYVNYEYATRQAALELTSSLEELGFQLEWECHVIDGDDEEWHFR